MASPAYAPSRRNLGSYGLADIVYRNVETKTWRWLAAGILIFVFRSIIASRTTPLGPDELLTYAQVRLPTIHALLQCLRTYPVAVDPPLYPVIAHFALRLPLPLELALRLPSIVSFAIVMLAAYAFVRHRSGVLPGLFAFALLPVVPGFQYAVEARTYSLLTAFSAVALLGWQRASERSDKRGRWLALLFVGAAGAVLTHYIGMLIIVPLLVGQSWKMVQQRRMDWPLLGVLAASAAAAITYLPFLKAASLYRVHPWYGVNIADLQYTYLLTFSPAVRALMALCCAWAIAVPASRPRAEYITFPAAESAALFCLYCIPGVMFLVAVFLTHSYVARYAVTYLIAAACLTGVILFLLSASSRLLQVLILSALFLGSFIPPDRAGRSAIAHFPPQATGGVTAKLPAELSRIPNLPIAFSSWVPYMRFRLYGPPELRNRLVLVSTWEDPSAVKDNVGLAVEAVGKALDVPNPDYQSFLRSNAEFLIVSDLELPLRDKAIAAGRRVTVVGKFFNCQVFRVS